jgi:hypothetical protein
VRGKPTWNYDTNAGGRMMQFNCFPDPEKLTGDKEAMAYGYFKDEPEYNAWAKDKYAKVNEAMFDNPDTPGLKELHKTWNSDVSQLINHINHTMEEITYYTGWENEGIENPGKPKYAPPKNEDTYIFEYGLNYTTSHEMQIFLELEKWLEEYARSLEYFGETTFKADVKHWEAVDPHLD